jgi:hypothetical protein
MPNASSRAIFLGIAAAALAAFARAQGASTDDSSLSELAKAKAEYEKDLEALGGDLLNKLDDALAKERSKPAPERDLEITKKRIEYIARDREHLLERGEWPTSIPTAEIHYHWTNDHRGKLREAYKSAIAAAARRGDSSAQKVLVDELGVFDRLNDLAPWQSLVAWVDTGEKEWAWSRVGDIFTSPAKGTIGGAKNPLRFRRAFPAEYALRFDVKWIDGSGSLVLGLVDFEGRQFDLPIEHASPTGSHPTRVSVLVLKDRFTVAFDGREASGWNSSEEFPVERDPPGPKGGEVFVASSDAGTRLKVLSAELKCLSWSGSASAKTAVSASTSASGAPTGGAGAASNGTSPSTSGANPSTTGARASTSGANASSSAAAASGVAAKQAARFEKASVITALLHGVDWLIRHQDKDGGWKLKTYTDVCPAETPCIVPGHKYSHDYDPGVTGLATFALVRAREQLTRSVSKEHVDLERIDASARAGLAWLISRQKTDGSFSKGKSFVYNEALGTLAVASAYGFTKQDDLKEPAQRAVDFITHAQRPSPVHTDALWGWRYASRMEIEDPRSSSNNPNFKKDLSDSDTSATGWAVLALRCGQHAGLDVKKESLEGAFEFVRSVTGDNGLVGYLDRTTAGQTINGANDCYIYHPAGMSALALCIVFFSKHDTEDPFVDLAARRLCGDLPTITKDKLSIDYYYWFCGTVALDQLDGPDSLGKGGKYWNPWNKSLVESLLTLQSKDEPACSNGAWLVPDRWSFTGGPIYATAINLLTLEDALGWK